MALIAIVQRIFPVVGRIVKVVNEAREAVKAGQEFAAEVESTLEGDHPLRSKAQAMLNEFEDVENAINGVLSPSK